MHGVQVSLLERQPGEPWRGALGAGGARGAQSTWAGHQLLIDSQYIAELRWLSPPRCRLQGRRVASVQLDGLRDEATPHTPAEGGNKIR